MVTLLALLALLGPDEKEADDALQKFKAAIKTSDVNARMQAVAQLGEVHHEKVMRALAQYLTTDEKGVRVVAVKAIGKFDIKKSLAVSLLAAALPANTMEVEVEEAIFTAFKELSDPSALPTAYQYFETKQEKVAEASIRLTGEIKSRNSIDPLLKLLKKLQNAGEAVGGSGTGTYGGQVVPADAELRARAQRLTAAAMKALELITGEKFGNLHDWDAWWKKNAAAFHVKN
jgi:HEAT repeat protein